MIIRDSAYATYRLNQLKKVRKVLRKTDKLLSPAWLKEKAFANSCNYDYDQEEIIKEPVPQHDCY